jgi:hypothetical protein
MLAADDRFFVDDEPFDIDNDASSEGVNGSDALFERGLAAEV